MAIRLDTLQAMDQGNPEPIGTLQEVREMGLRPIKYGSCSMPSSGNIGCKHYDSEIYGPCPIRQALIAKRRKPYENVAFLRILSPTVQKQDAMKCHQYMDNLAHEDPKNGINHIIGFGGDVTIKRRISEMVDPKDPRTLMRVRLKLEKVPAIARPKESMADRAATMELARDIQAKELQGQVDIVNAAGYARGVPAEDQHQTEEGDLDVNESGMSEAELQALGDDLQGDGLEDADILGDDDSSGEETSEPETLRQISGRGRKRKSGDG